MATAELPQGEDPIERERREVKARMVRALWIPLAAVLGVAFYVLNFSRVLIAGKGHENHQEIAGKRLPFSDAAVARAALAGRSMK